MDRPPSYESSGQSSGSQIARHNDWQEQGAPLELLTDIRDPKMQQEVVKTVSMELLLRESCDWGTLLSHAPRALSSLGQCFVVASTEMAHSIDLPLSEELRYSSLRANLVHCSDLGRTAFREAEVKMYKVGMYTQFICEKDGTIDKILQCLEDDTLAKHELPDHLQKLKSFAQDCIRDTSLVKKQFAVWQNTAEAIRRQCVNKDSTVSKENKELESKSQILDVQKENLEKDLKVLERQMEEQKIRVDDHKKKYDKAEKKVFSSAWADNMQRFVGTIVDGVGSVAETGATILVQNLSIIQHPYVKIAVPIVNAFIANKDAAPEKQSTEDEDDIGYMVANNLKNLLQRFLEQSMGEDGSTPGFHGMDWPSISGYSQKGMSLSSLLYSVDQYRNELKGSKSKSEATQRAMEILDGTWKTCIQIDGWVKLERNGGSIDQLKENTVTSWRIELQQMRDHARQHAESANTHTAHGTKAQENKMKTSGKYANVFSNLRFHRENYEASQRVLDEAEKRLEERQQRQRRETEKFNEIQLQLQSLAEDQMTMTQVRKVLDACTKNLTDLQHHVDQLTTFFSELHIFIETTYETRGQEFARVAGGMDRLVQDKAPEERTAFKRQRIEMLLLQSLKLRAYYSVMREISSMYVEVSKKYIMPGVNWIDELSLGDSSSSGFSQAQITSKVKAISDFADNARVNVDALANKRKQRLLDQLYQRRGEAEEVKHIIEDAEKNKKKIEDNADGQYWAD